MRELLAIAIPATIPATVPSRRVTSAATTATAATLQTTETIARLDDPHVEDLEGGGHDQRERKRGPRELPIVGREAAEKRQVPSAEDVPALIGEGRVAGRHPDRRVGRELDPEQDERDEAAEPRGHGRRREHPPLLVLDHGLPIACPSAHRRASTPVKTSAAARRWRGELRREDRASRSRSGVRRLPEALGTTGRSP